jgi:hypoxanthine phosphoribosyltransferase
MNQEINYKDVIKVPGEGLVSPKRPQEKISPNMKTRIDRVLIPEECIRERVSALAEQIAKDYKSKGVKKIYLVAVLKGAFVFAADLGREIDRADGPELVFDFYEAQTYGQEIKQNGEKKRRVKIFRRPENIKGKDVLLVDDLNDTAVTLNEIIKDLTEEIGLSPSKLKTCVLVDKVLTNPTEEIKKIKSQLNIDYVGFEGPDRWVAGYGIDAGEDFRALRSIVAVKESYYLNKS